MNILVYLVLPMIGSIFILFAQIYGMRQMGTNKSVPAKVRRMAAVLYVVFSVLLPVFLPPSANMILNLMIFAGMPLLGNRLYHSGKKYFMYYLLLAVIVYMTDAVVITGFQTMIVLGAVYLNSQELLTVLMICTVRVIEYMVIRLVVCMVRKNNGLDIKGRQFAVSLALPAFSMLNLFTLLYGLQVYLTEGMMLLFLLNLVCLIGLNIYFAVLIDTMSERERLKQELVLSRQQSEMQCRYYEQEQKKYDESRKILHDIRNHIVTMEQLYRDHAAGEAAEYAGEIHHMLNSLGQTYYTSEKILNIIINDKVRLMKRLGIQEDIRIGEIDVSFMQEIEITTIFANLFDNAITAAGSGNGEKENAWVRLRVEPVRQFISIRMENSCDTAPERKGAFFKSGKSGHEGIGFRNIKRAAERYGGDVQCEWREGVFYTRILLVQERSEKIC